MPQVHPFIIPIPEIRERTIEETDRLLVLASDGVWDVLENDETLGIAGSNSVPVSCQQIVSESAKRWDRSMPGRRDDITAVLIDLAHPDVK